MAHKVLNEAVSLKLNHMRGVITTRHLVTHAPLIMRLFGVRAYFKCVACVLRKGGRATFLDAVSH